MISSYGIDHPYVLSVVGAGGVYSDRAIVTASFTAVTRHPKVVRRGTGESGRHCLKVRCLTYIGSCKSRDSRSWGSEHNRQMMWRSRRKGMHCASSRFIGSEHSRLSALVRQSDSSMGRSRNGVVSRRADLQEVVMCMLDVIDYYFKASSR